MLLITGLMARSFYLVYTIICKEFFTYEAIMKSLKAYGFNTHDELLLSDSDVKDLKSPLMYI
jgi:hypothetical protein